MVMKGCVTGYHSNITQYVRDQMYSYKIGGCNNIEYDSYKVQSDHEEGSRVNTNSFNIFAT